MPDDLPLTDEEFAALRVDLERLCRQVLDVIQPACEARLESVPMFGAVVLAESLAVALGVIVGSTVPPTHHHEELHTRSRGIAKMIEAKARAVAAHVAAIRQSSTVN